MSADKIDAQHLARKAVLYVRQSSTHQVQHNRESQVLQYAMRDRLVQLGWSDIEVIDEDLGGSVRSCADCKASSFFNCAAHDEAITRRTMRLA